MELEKIITVAAEEMLREALSESNRFQDGAERDIRAAVSEILKEEAEKLVESKREEIRAMAIQIFKDAEIKVDVNYNGHLQVNFVFQQKDKE